MVSDSDILIVGAGCFGLSTALHLRRNSSVSVTLLDRQSFPCRDSASQDSSRIIRADYPDPFYATLGEEALNAWRSDSTFKSAFHETGWLFAGLPGDDFVLDSYKVQKNLFSRDVQILQPHDVAARFPGLAGNLDGWNIYSNPAAGWANATEAMQSTLDEFRSLGGNFIAGPSGTFISLLIDPSNSGEEKVAGVQTIDGTRYRASTVLLAVGAEIPRLVNTESQVQPLGFCVAHWRLTPEELATWANHPVVDLHGQGYFFPPDASGLMKIGWGMSAYSNAAGPWPSSTGSSIPVEAEEGMRRILRMTAPGLANKPFFDMKICWDGMTDDKNWLISPVPGKNGLFVAGGGSGHAFKFLPIIGRYVANMIEGVLPSEHEKKWRWREGSGDPRRAISGRPIKELGLSQAKI